MKKNEIYEGTVLGYGSEGEGILKNGEYVVFLPFVIMGEVVRYKVLKVDKNIVYAKALDIIEQSLSRRTPDCEVFGKCGGCRLLHMSYEEQLVYKRNLIESTIKKIAFIPITLNKMSGSIPELRYRNKLQLPLRRVNGNNIVGFFAPDSHRVVETNDCIIQGEWCSQAITAIKEFASEKSLSFYDESADNGLMRHLIVKKVGESFLVCVVLTSENLPYKEYFFEKLKSKFKTENITLTLNVNRGRNNVILGDKTIVLYGEGVVYGEQFGIKYSVGTNDFIQVNDGVKQVLYSDAVELACIGNPSMVIDAYCGGGLMTALLSQKAKNAVGVEIVPEAIENAKRLVKANGITNAKFVCGACEDVLPSIVSEADGDCAVVLDPPRKGVDKRLIASLLKSKIKKIVYVSCNPATLARDIGLLCGSLVYDGAKLIRNTNCNQGEYYNLQSVSGYDMFSACKGVESLALLSR